MTDNGFFYTLPKAEIWKPKTQYVDSPLVCLNNCINKSSNCYNKLHLNWAIYVDRLTDYGSFVTRNKEQGQV